eukprot:Pgem_evm1s6342
MPFVIMAAMAAGTLAGKGVQKSKANTKKNNIKKQTNYKNENFEKKFEFDCYFQVALDKNNKPIPLPVPLIMHRINKRKEKREIKKTKEKNKHFGSECVKANAKIVITKDDQVFVIKNDDSKTFGGHGLDERFGTKAGAINLDQIIMRIEKNVNGSHFYYLSLKSDHKREYVMIPVCEENSIVKLQNDVESIFGYQNTNL